VNVFPCQIYPEHIFGSHSTEYVNITANGTVLPLLQSVSCLQPSLRWVFCIGQSIRKFQ